MRTCFLILAIILSPPTQVSVAQYRPLDRCVQDSLFMIMPHENAIQKARIFLELAQFFINDPQISINYLVPALRIANKENDIALKGKVRLLMGDYYNNTRRFILAQEQYLAALKIYQSISYTDGELDALGQIGALNSNLLNRNAALDYFNKALAVAKKANSLHMQGKFLNLIASIYQQMGDYNRAMQLYLEAESAYRRSDNKQNELDVQNNIGSILIDQNKHDAALRHYEQLLKTADTTNAYLMGMLYTRIGHIYSLKKDYLNSLRYNRKALTKRRKVHHDEGENSSLINVAGDYFMLGQADSGKIYMDKGLQIAIRNNRRNLVENGYRHLYNYYLNQGNYHKALDYYTLYVSEGEIITRDRNRSNISILEANQRIQRIQEDENRLIKQIEIQTLNIGNQVHQFIFVQVMTAVATIVMLIFIFLFFYNQFVRRKMQMLNDKLSAEILEREAAERQTAERERQYRFMSENSGDFITHMDSQKRWIYASPASVRVFGYEPAEIIQKRPYDLMHPGYHAYAEDNLRHMIETRSSRQFNFQAVKKDGTFFWAESVGSPLFDQATGEFKGMVAVTRDIQERKTKELEIMEGTRQKEILLKEIHHRVKNNFAILVSLINMQIAQNRNPELLKSLTNLQLRIRTMSLVHEMLYRSKDFENISFPDYLRTLASVIAGTYNRRDISLTFEADDIVMDIDAAIPLGLIVNEILSNAYLHAFPGNRPGNIHIFFRNDPEKRTNTLVLKDDGIGMPAIENPDQIKTMGLQIVHILCKQIDGSLVLRNDPGTSFTITF